MSDTIIALALLKTNWELKRSSYIDNFNALTGECLRQSPVDVVSAPEVREAMNRLFGLRIPLNTVDTLLARAKKHGFLSQDHGVYRINRKAIAELRFADERERVVRMHDQLVTDIANHARGRFGITWAAEDAERALHGYLADNTLALFRSTATRSFLPLPKRPSKSDRYVLSSYVNTLIETNAPGFESLRVVVEGTMLATGIFLPSPGSLIDCCISNRKLE